MSDAADRARSLDRHAFDAWPAELRTLFDGASPEQKVGFAASLVIVDADDEIRTSLLGPGELYAPDARTLCIALWPDSRAARTFAAAGDAGRRASLTFVLDGSFYQLSLKIEPLPATTDDDATLACFAGTLTRGEWQRVGYARLTGGITFELPEDDREGVLARWREQIDLLKRAAARRG